MPQVESYDRHTPINRVVATGTIRTNAKWPLGTRLEALNSSVVTTICDWAGTDDVLVVVEFPPTKRRPPSAKFARQSTLYLPHYGMAVGAVWCAGLAYGNGTESQSIQLQSIAADAWPWKGLPSGDSGKNKGARQDYCRRLLKAAFLPEHLPNKGSSSDIADALLIAEKVAAMTGFSKGRVIAFDPSLTSTGWAVVQH